MVNRSGQIGTSTETAVVRVLRASGWPHAERRRLRGRLDCGDITGTPGLLWEVKGGAAARTASDNQIAEWLAETASERDNDRADIGILVVARKGIGAANAHRWWAITTTGGGLLAGPIDDVPARFYLGDLCRMLTAAGYGTTEPMS